MILRGNGHSVHERSRYRCQAASFRSMKQGLLLTDLISEKTSKQIARANDFSLCPIWVGATQPTLPTRPTGLISTVFSQSQAPKLSSSEGFVGDLTAQRWG